MKVINKKEINGKKYISFLGLNIPYRTEGDDEKRKIIIGFATLPYYKDSSTDSIYIKLFGRKIYIEKGRRLKHYLMRDQLDVNVRKKIIEEEVSPILGYKMNLTNPKSYNEKINWLKLYNEDPRITRCCDKYAVKGYVEEKLGPGYVVPTIDSWDDPDDIDFNSLPNQFVLKVNWSSGFNIIVKDKAEIDERAIKDKLKRWMMPHSNSYYSYFNWGYKNMKPVCYAEQYIEQMDGQLYDYKFLFNNGKLIYLLIVADRLSDKTITKTFFDDKFEIMPFTSGGSAYGNPELPKTLNLMLEKAKILADDFPFVRVDFYEVDGQIKIGEMTFYCGGGKLPVSPVEWDFKIGEKIDISSVIERNNQNGNEKNKEC